MHDIVHVHVHGPVYKVFMCTITPRDAEKGNNNTTERQSNTTQLTLNSHFSKKNWLPRVGVEPIIFSCVHALTFCSVSIIYNLRACTCTYMYAPVSYNVHVDCPPFSVPSPVICHGIRCSTEHWTKYQSSSWTYRCAMYMCMHPCTCTCA